MTRGFVLMVVLLGGLASARADVRVQSQRIADQLAAVEDQLDARDLEEVRDALDRIDWVLSRYEDRGSRGSLVCVSNGSSGVFEKFRLTDLSTGKSIGGETSLETCRSALASQKFGLLCLSNGSSGVFEKFRIYDLARQASLGGETLFETCLKSVRQGTRAAICLSNGSSGVFEKFSLYNRLTNKRIGGETTFETCQSALPR
ncbi:MAG TPA: hypothetical protein PL182_06275 [Pseudobdellovibrionaceae bacterium]|nr:hypothetical protein [Pseudobdellovibrionaceae bacterium]